MAVACAAADLLEAGKLEIDLVMLLEGEEETVRNPSLCKALVKYGF